MFEGLNRFTRVCWYSKYWNCW